MITGKELAKKILEQVDSHPETLYMGTWESEKNGELYDWKTDKYVEGCGTTRCVAGWAVHFNARRGEDIFSARNRLQVELGTRGCSFMDVAGRLLGLNEREAGHVFLEADEGEAVDVLRRLAQSG